MINPFIDDTYFISFNGLDESIDSKIINSAIEKAQEKYFLSDGVDSLLGTALYNELQLQIENETLAGDNLTLVNSYIAPALAKYALFEVIPSLMFKIENASIYKRGSENSENVDFKELTFLRQIAKDDAEFFASKLTKYLIANPTLYPLFDRPGNSLDTSYPKRNSSYTTSIYLRKKRN